MQPKLHNPAPTSPEAASAQPSPTSGPSTGKDNDTERRAALDAYITGSNVWRDLETQFRALPEDLGAMYLSDGRWTVHGGGRDKRSWTHAQSLFRSLARRGAIQASVPSRANALYEWLNLLRYESVHFEHRNQGGVIRNVGLASAEYCMERAVLASELEIAVVSDGLRRDRYQLVSWLGNHTHEALSDPTAEYDYWKSHIWKGFLSLIEEYRKIVAGHQRRGEPLWADRSEKLSDAIVGLSYDLAVLEANHVVDSGFRGEAATDAFQEKAARILQEVESAWDDSIAALVISAEDATEQRSSLSRPFDRVGRDLGQLLQNEGRRNHNGDGASDPAVSYPRASSPEFQAAVRKATTINGADEVQAEVAPENLPLPQLPEALAHEVNVAKAEALVKLHDELNAIWVACFPVQDEQRLRTPAPDQFFPPFVAYGVAMYLARADALLKLQPEPLTYQDWLNFGLKTQICDELAPCRQAETLGKPACDVWLSEWQVHMGITWRHFDHPMHSELFSKAQKLMNALEDPMDQHWERFGNSLHNAMSRRTMSLLAIAVKALSKPKSEPQLTLTAQEDVTGQADALRVVDRGSPGVIPKARPGPKPDLETARRVHESVTRVAGTDHWKKRLDDICEVLDDKEIPCPKTWARRELPIRSWTEAAASRPERDLAIKAITYHLKIARA